MKTKRITTWDVTKGFGMLLVILGHLVSEESYLRNFIYSFHMPLFFILSGFVQKHDDKKRRLIELIRSEKKIIIVYLFWSAIYFALDLIIRFGLLKTVHLRGIIERVIYIVSTYGINVLWFIGSLIVGRILTKKLLSLTGNEKMRWIFTAILVIVSASLSSVLDLINSWSISVILTVMLRGSFTAGLILFGYLIRDRVVALIERGDSLLGILLLLMNVVIANQMGGGGSSLYGIRSMAIIYSIHAYGNLWIYMSL